MHRTLSSKMSWGNRELAIHVLFQSAAFWPRSSLTCFCWTILGTSFRAFLGGNVEMGPSCYTSHGTSGFTEIGAICVLRIGSRVVGGHKPPS